MSRERSLEEQISDLKIDIRREKEWNDIPQSLKPTSKGRWDQLRDKEKLRERRRNG